MSDRKTHLGAGALVGIGVGVYSVRNLEGWPVVARMLGAVLASVAGAALPDVLEPALHSWHRRSFHSWGALAGTAGVTLGPPAAGLSSGWAGEGSRSLPVPGAMRRIALAKRCFAEPGAYQTPRFVRLRLCSAPLRKSYALRCVRGTSPFTNL